MKTNNSPGFINIFKNISLSISIIIICVLTFELFLRYSSYDFFQSYRPVNAPEKNQDNILVLGDSFTEWYECWPDRLDYLYSGRKKIINMAFAGTGPNIYLLRLKKHIADFKHSQILIGLYVGNDFWDVKRPKPRNANIFYKFYYLADNTLISLKWLNIKLGRVFPIKRPNMKLEKVFPMLTKKIELKPQKENDNKTKILLQSSNDDNRGELSQDARRRCKMYPDMQKDAIMLDSEFSRSQFDATMEYIRNIRDVGREYGAKTTLIIIPASSQVSAVYNEAYDACGLTIHESMLDNSIVQDKIKEYCSMLDIDCIDVLPYFRTLDHTKNPIYYYNDIHLNNLGQSLMAEFIYSKLGRL